MDQTPEPSATVMETDKELSATATRPTTLSILLDNSLRSPILPTFSTPCLSDLQPILRSEVEKLLQQWKSSPQTPGTFLNPQHITEEQERFANAFTQKLNELKDPTLSSIATASTPVTVTSSNLYSVSLSDLTPQNLPNFAELCRQAVQQQQQQQQTKLADTPILFYSTGFDSGSLSTAQSATTTLATANSSGVFESQKPPTSLSTLQNALHGSVSITLPASAISLPGKELTTLQLPNGLKFEISSNNGLAQASVLKILGLDQSSDPVDANVAGAGQPPPDPILWPLRVQSSTGSEAVNVELCRNNYVPSPRGDCDTRPSSVSSSSSSSQTNINDMSRSHPSDTRLDPTEQYRMRLERKRARNRDAARKCRERKIRLIKSLEKDVCHLSEENKSLRNRLSRCKVEVERLKTFVANHLDKECMAISSKVL